MALAAEKAKCAAVELKLRASQAECDEAKAGLSKAEGDLAMAHQVVEAGKAMLFQFQAGKTLPSPKVRTMSMFPFSRDSSVAEADVEVGESVGFGASDRMLSAVQGKSHVPSILRGVRLPAPKLPLTTY